MADITKLSPMMSHYMSLKQGEYQNEILFYRLGDFYEMFFEDAIICSRELELTLTGKDCGMEERAPMCGIPYHAADTYIARLVEKGYRVAICEQVSDPKQAGRNLVERQVVKVITAGTALEDEVLEPNKNNYLLCISATKSVDGFGVAWADISTGSLEMCEVSGKNAIKLLDDIIVRVKPSEIITTREIKDKIEEQLYVVKVGLVPRLYPFDQANPTFSKAEKLVKNQFSISSLAVFDA